MVRRPRRHIGWRAAALGALGLAAAVAFVVAVSAPLRDDAATEARREAARQAATEATEIRRLRADAVPRRATAPRQRAGEDPLERRRALVTRTEALITRDAQGRTRAGTLSGAVVGTACEPYPGISERREAEADPAVTVGRYECIAFQRQVDLPELKGNEHRRGVLGFPFWAVIHYERGAIVWCKVTPRAGEGGRSLASVPVPPPCRDPHRSSP